MSELSRQIIYIILYYIIHEHFNLVKYECQRNVHLAVIRYKKVIINKINNFVVNKRVEYNIILYNINHMQICFILITFWSHFISNSRYL